MPVRLKIGDIFEITTKNGLAYAQFTHKNNEYGYLIRVLDGIFNSRPDDFQELAAKKHRFVTFFPLGAAVQRKVVSVVGNVDVPNDASKFPLFRAGTPLPDGVVYTWWLWDGTKSWRIGKLPPEQIELPIEEVVNYAALVHMIESGWTPATDKITLRSIKAD